MAGSWADTTIAGTSAHCTSIVDERSTVLASALHLSPAGYDTVRPLLGSATSMRSYLSSCCLESKWPRMKQ